jgi:hypothetical protein
MRFGAGLASVSKNANARMLRNSISEGWIRVQAGKTVDRRGKPLTIKLSGPVEVWFENPAAEDTPAAE